jgi:hypothetical protein
MATGLQVIGRLAPLLGLLPSTLERQLRAQRLARQLPTGRPGGGKFSAHFEAQHFVNVILGLAGPEPSDAPAAAAALRLMPLQTAKNPPPGVPPPLPALEDQLADWLAVIAEAYRRGGKDLRAIVATFQDWELSLCLNPRRAVIQTDVSKQRVILYAIEDAPFALRRVTVLHGNLMLAAGELLADSFEQINAIAAMQLLSSTQPAQAGAGQKSAGNLRPEAPAPFGDQPRTHGTDRTSNTQDGIHVEREFQARPVTLTETGSDDRCQTTTMLMT